MKNKFFGGLWLPLFLLFLLVVVVAWSFFSGGGDVVNSSDVLHEEVVVSVPDSSLGAVLENDAVSPFVKTLLNLLPMVIGISLVLTVVSTVYNILKGGDL